MSVKDVIKNSFLQQMGSYDLGNIAISLVAAVLLGVFIYYVYKTFYTGVIYSRSFAVTLVGMCVLTCPSFVSEQPLRTRWIFSIYSGPSQLASQRELVCMGWLSQHPLSW